METDKLMALMHPFGGLGTIFVTSAAAYFGWQFRQARLKVPAGAPASAEVVKMREEHKKAGFWVLGMTILVWLGGSTLTDGLKLDKVVEGSPHETTALLLVGLAVTSAAVILFLRQFSWAKPLHLALNSLFVLVLAGQLFSGVGILAQIFK